MIYNSILLANLLKIMLQTTNCANTLVAYNLLFLLLYALNLNYIYLFVCMCSCTCACHTHMWRSENNLEFVLLQPWVLCSNSGHEAWQKVPLPWEPSHHPALVMSTSAHPGLNFTGCRLTFLFHKSWPPQAKPSHTLQMRKGKPLVVLACFPSVGVINTDQKQLEERKGMFICEF